MKTMALAFTLAVLSAAASAQTPRCGFVKPDRIECDGPLVMKGNISSGPILNTTSPTVALRPQTYPTWETAVFFTIDNQPAANFWLGTMYAADFPGGSCSPIVPDYTILNTSTQFVYEFSCGSVTIHAEGRKNTSGQGRYRRTTYTMTSGYKQVQ